VRHEEAHSRLGLVLRARLGGDVGALKWRRRGGAGRGGAGRGGAGRGGAVRGGHGGSGRRRAGQATRRRLAWALRRVQCAGCRHGCGSAAAGAARRGRRSLTSAARSDAILARSRRDHGAPSNGNRLPGAQCGRWAERVVRAPLRACRNVAGPPPARDAALARSDRHCSRATGLRPGCGASDAASRISKHPPRCLRFLALVSHGRATLPAPLKSRP
jgi:hypothetical protein